MSCRHILLSGTFTSLTQWKLFVSGLSIRQHFLKLLSMLNQHFLTPGQGQSTMHLVHGKTTDEWHTNDIWVHTSDIRVTYEYMRVTYGWCTSTNEWHTNEIRVDTSEKRMTYKWHTDDIRFERKIKLTSLKLFDNPLSKYLISKSIPCMQWIYWVIYKI